MICFFAHTIVKINIFEIGRCILFLGCYVVKNVCCINIQFDAFVVNNNSKGTIKRLNDLCCNIWTGLTRLSNVKSCCNFQYSFRIPVISAISAVILAYKKKKGTSVLYQHGFSCATRKYLEIAEALSKLQSSKAVRSGLIERDGRKGSSGGSIVFWRDQTMRVWPAVRKPAALPNQTRRILTLFSTFPFTTNYLEFARLALNF